MVKWATQAGGLCAAEMPHSVVMRKNMELDYREWSGAWEESSLLVIPRLLPRQRKCWNVEEMPSMLRLQLLLLLSPPNPSW
jgi:hypothetical protein